MPLRSLDIFLDTSVTISALMSHTGGARLLFHLAQAGAIRLVVGKGVLQEAEEVLRRKAPGLVGLLAQLLNEVNVAVGPPTSKKHLQAAQSLLPYPPDASILAQALASQCDWFVSHDKEHFLDNPALKDLPFQIGTPGEVIAWLREQRD